MPFSETILTSRQVRTTELHNFLSQLAVRAVLDPATRKPKATDAVGRSDRRLVVDVVVMRGGHCRRATACGRGIYAVSAPLAREVVGRLIAGKFRSAGAHAPGEIFDAGAVLAGLGSDNSTFELIAA